MNVIDFNEVVGLDFHGFDESNYVLEMEVHPRHYNVRGIVHGGVICTLLDTAMTRSFLHSLPEAERNGATLEMKVNFLKATRSGKLTAYGKQVNKTSRTAYVEGYVINDDEHLVAKASSTIMLFDENRASASSTVVSK